MKLAALFLCATTWLSAQVRIHTGIQLGIPVTDTLQSSSSFTTNSIPPASQTYNNFSSVTKRVIAGPVFRLEVSKNFSVEFDALYQRVDSDQTYRYIQPAANQSTYIFDFQQSSANRFEMPLLVQYSHALPGKRTAVIAEGGLSIEHFTSSRIKSSNLSATGASASVSSGATATNAGVVFGGGVDLQFYRTHLRPELRYTRWLASAQALAGALAVVNPLNGSSTIPVYALPFVGGSGNPNEATLSLSWQF